MAVIIDTATGRIAEFSAFILLVLDSKSRRVLGAMITSYDAMGMTIHDSNRFATLQEVKDSTLDRAIASARSQLSHQMYDWIGPMNERGERTADTKPSDLLAREDKEDGSSTAGAMEIKVGGAR